MLQKSSFNRKNDTENIISPIAQCRVRFFKLIRLTFSQNHAPIFNLIFIFFVSNTSIAANDLKSKINKIKNDPAMIWAEREAADVITARQLAETDLLQKIQVSITVSTSATQEEKITGNSVEMTDDFTRQHQSYSHLYLKGLDYIEVKQKKNYRVIAFISRQSLTESFNVQKNKIRSFATAGIKHSGEGRIGEALKNIYWGYLLALTYPDSIHLFGTSSGGSTNPPIAMQNMLNQLLSDVEVRFIQSYLDGGLLIIELGFEHSGKPITDLDFSYYSGMGMEYSPVVDGKAVIPLHEAPASNAYPLTISLEYAYEGDMTEGSEIAKLYDSFQQTTFDNRKTVIVRLADYAVSSNPDIYSQPMDITPSPFLVLNQQTSWSEFKDILEQYVRLGELRYGKKSDFENPNGCHIAVIDNQTVKDLLSVNGDSYYSLKTQQSYNDLADKYQGCVQIWLREE